MEVIIISNTLTGIIVAYIAIRFGAALGQACDELCNRLLDQFDYWLRWLR